MGSQRSGTRRRRLAAALLGTAALVAVGVPPAQAATGVPAPAAGTPQPHDGGLDPTPYMGWNTYYGLGAPTESQVKSVARFLVDSGLKKSGYDIVWLDGGWQAPTPRDPATGELVADPSRFPSGMPALVDYIHRLGLKAGIYTDAGVYDGTDCGLGSGGHYTQDADQFARWKFDAIKADFLCGIAEKMDPGTAYRQFGAAVAKAGRPMLLNLCNPLTADWGLPHTPAQDATNAYWYGPTTADSWRTGTDIAWGSPTAGEWPNVLRNMDVNAEHPEAQGPGHWNDPDYLVPMRQLAGGGLEMTETESTSQFEMWAEMASPLMLGSDPRTLPASMLAVLRDPEIIAVDQDPLGIQGVRVATDAVGDVYSKVLTGSGQRAVVLLNRSDQAQARTVRFADAALAGTVRVRDLTARQDRGAFTGSYTVEVPAHGTAMLRLSGTDTAPGTAVRGATSSADPALVSGADGASAVFTRSAGGALLERTGDGAGWSAPRDLGGPDGGRFLGRPAAYGSAGGRIAVFVRGTDDHAWRREFDGRRWGPWQDLGGSLTDAPTAAYAGPGDWTLYARGADGAVWSRGTSGGWTSLGTPAGEPVTGAPSAVASPSGGAQVAVRTPDDQIWWRSRDAAGVWSDWTALGGTVSGGPTLMASGDTVHLYARAGDYTLWQRSWTAAGGWTGWAPHAGFVSGTFTGALGAAAGPDGTVRAAFRGVNDRVYVSTL